MNYFVSRSVFTLLAFVLCVATLSAQDVRSRFLPDKVYTVTIKKTLAGNDGFQDIPPSTSTQRMRIETGPAANGGIPVDLTIFRTQQRGEEQSDAVDWRFTFTAMNDGAIGDARVVSSAEQMDNEFAYAMVSRMLEPVLFHTTLTLKEANKNRTVIGKTVARPGATDFIDVEYTIDFSASEAERGVAGGPLTAEARGTALFNAALSFFTERKHTEVSKIFIAEDALGAENNLRMDRTLGGEVRVEGKR